ncbi:maleylpyruvate isomerase N-terminal domain-containing protein [Pseudonocardia sp. Cha107L01]|uniref:maleylpyruvate isomerase N-terminal domain-containing protein n=1 Tax=Pseudonocardia sp. Cha107L01 TaxID=3457576 RepID=UPI00403EC434
MTSTPTSPARQHAYDAARFTELVESASTGDWARPSPIAEWTALDIVKHLVEWPREFLKGAGIDLPALDVEDDPAAAWTQHVADIQAIVDDPAGRVLSNPHTGNKPVDEAIDQFYTADLWMHSWDSPRHSAASWTWARSAARPRWRPWSRSSRRCATAANSVPPWPSPPTPPRRTN